MTWEEVIQKLERYRELKDDWDGEGTPAPTDKQIGQAILMVKAFRMLGATCPDIVEISANGVIEFYFKCQPGSGLSHLQLDIGEGKLPYFIALEEKPRRRKER